jgi:hypothetical protein
VVGDVVEVGSGGLPRLGVEDLGYHVSAWGRIAQKDCLLAHRRFRWGYLSRGFASPSGKRDLRRDVGWCRHRRVS